MDRPVQLSQLPWTDVNEFARQKEYMSGSRRIRLLELRPGFEEAIWCNRGHVGYVIEGELEISFKNSQRKSFQAGDILILPSGQQHKAKTVGEAVRLFLVDD